MYFNNNESQGYTRGGIDVITAVNLFFKFLLLSPVFLLAGFVFVTMLKHMIFQGIPSMSVPTIEQREILREKDTQVSEFSSLNSRVSEVSVDTVREKDTPVRRENTGYVRNTQNVVNRNVTPRVISAVEPAGRMEEELNEVGYQEERLREFCINTWLPEYGNNPNANGSACERFK